AVASDKPRITEISSQIWDGDDYVPEVLDDWLADSRGEVIVAIVDEKLISFARRSYLLPGYAWLEGARTDPAYRNTGVFQEISRYFLDAVQREGADLIGLSTYIDNKVSIHIIEKNGFRKAASYVYLESGHDAPVTREGQPSTRVFEVTPEEAIPFIHNSEFLHVAHGLFPHGWKFYPFERDPQQVVAKMQSILGMREEGRLVGLLCVGECLRHTRKFTIDYIDGQPDAVEELLRHGIHLAAEHRAVEMMIPKDEAAEAPVLPILKYMRFKAWNDFSPDVFVYEHKP
ncbi:MAG: GNAT family N-acetyltransferase, partial [Candidatus Bipolaricaulota bacterium]|nr:GNAT family N-acetyltransferase [Candidatus Bipolaricaulota bacterium]